MNETEIQDAVDAYLEAAWQLSPTVFPSVVIIRVSQKKIDTTGLLWKK